jgi:hypothetical protein
MYDSAVATTKNLGRRTIFRPRFSFPISSRGKKPLINQATSYRFRVPSGNRFLDRRKFVSWSSDGCLAMESIVGNTGMHRSHRSHFVPSSTNIKCTTDTHGANESCFQSVSSLRCRYFFLCYSHGIRVWHWQSLSLRCLQGYCPLPSSQKMTRRQNYR